MTRTEYLARTVTMAIELMHHLNLSDAPTPDGDGPRGRSRWARQGDAYGNAYDLAEEAFGLLCETLYLSPAETANRWCRYNEDCWNNDPSCVLSWLREDAA